MKVLLHPADQGGCGHYRMVCPGRVVESQGVEVEITPDIPREQGVNNPLDVRPGPTDADVIVFQRPCKGWVADFIPMYQARGHAVVVDVDDDFSCLHPNHPGRLRLNPSLNSEINWHHLQRACRAADLVTVTSPSIAERYGAHGRVAILPNCVPAELLDMPRTSDGHTLGWGGQFAFHLGDMAATRGGVAEALRRNPNWRFLVVGEREDGQQQLALDEPPDETGFLGLDGWYDALGKLDVGIVPLGSTRFNEGKSYLKGIEYAARGIPFVASELPEYQYLAENGIGMLAQERGRSWRAALCDLIRDESLRAEMVQSGRERVEEAHTYEGEAWRWAEAWTQALENRRGRKAA